MYRPFAVRVGALAALSPHFIRVTLTSEDLAGIDRGGPDQRIKVVFPSPSGRLDEFPTGEDWYQQWRSQPDDARNPIRTYTIRHADRHARELVVDFVAHGETGPASRWVSRARVGDPLLVLAPAHGADEAGGYEFRPGPASTLLLAGDETAAPAIAAILESLPGHAAGAVFLEVPSPADALPLHAPPGMTLSWLPRDGANHGARLDEAVRSWAAAWVAAHGGTSSPTSVDDPDDVWDVPAAPSVPGLYAWLAGESGTITRLRRHLVGERGIDRSRVAFMGYWRLGRAEN